jgi:DNA polymerase III sliding clamp (beta) subunit (PCNA family)
MKFEINKNILTEGLRVVCNSLDTVSLNPVGDCVLLVVSKTNIKLFSNNSFLSCFYEINNNFTCFNEGKVLIKGKLFYSIISKLDNQNSILIEIVDNSVIRIKQSKFSSDINLLDSTTFITSDFNFSN